MAGLIGFARGTVATLKKHYPDLRAEFRAVQLLTFTVISRCCSPGVQIALKSCREYLDAGHRAWHFIKSTYQVTDALYIGQLEEQLSHIRMGEEETATDYCNRARRILATMRMAGVQYSTASYLTHVIKGLMSSYNLLKRLSLVSSTRATLNEDSLTSYILQDEAMQEAERPSEPLAQVNYVAPVKQGGRPGQRGQYGGGGSSGWKPTKNADKKKSAKDSGRGGGSRRRECWLCGDPDHLSFECPCQRSTGDPRLILGKGYRLVVLGGYGRTGPLLNKPFYPNGLVVGILTWYKNEGLGFESQCVHFGHPSAGGCQRSTGDPRLILGKGYRLVVLGGYGRTGPLLNKPFYPNGGCQRSTGDPRLILGKGYRLVILGGYGRTDPLLNKPFYPSGLVVGILTAPTAEVFVDLQPNGDVKHVRGFNGALQDVQGRGTVTLQGEAGRQVLIPDVLYVPGVRANLFLAGQLKENGVKLQDDGDGMLLISAAGDILAQAFYTGLHARLAHVDMNTIRSSAKHEVATGLDLKSATSTDLLCVSCVGEKLARHTFPDQGSDADNVLAVVHVDLCGPLRVAAKDGSLYFLLLKDRKTRYVWVRPVAKKSDALQEFVQWLAVTERQTKKSVLMLRSDQGGEFLGKQFTNFVNGKGIVHDLTCPDTPQQNGMAEREMRTVVESVRTMLLHMGMQHHWWHLALRQTVWVRNSLERSTLQPGTTPYQLLTGKKPDLSLARVWGCIAQFLVPEQQRGGKLQLKARWGLHLGVSEKSKGWDLLDIADNRVVTTVGATLRFAFGLLSVCVHACVHEMVVGHEII
ncbi:unnamed protein product [Closterium sp. NIES-53]